MLRVVVLLENNTFLSRSPEFEVFESAEILLIKDFDIVRPTHNSLDAVNPSHAPPCDAPPHHQTSRAMFNGLLREAFIESLPRLDPAILTAIGLE